MSEETQTVDSSSTEPTEEVVAEEPTTSAETETTETAPAEHMIPKSRLDEVIAQRNELREKISALEAKPKEAPATPASVVDAGELPDPPAGLTERQIINWYVQQDGVRAVENALGMSLADAKKLLSTTKETSQDYSQRKWVSMCQEKGIDAANEDVQAVFYGLCKGGMDTQKALDRTATIFGKKAANGKPNTPKASVETNGVTGVMTGTKVVPRDKKQAHAMAVKGQRADHLSIEEILERRKEEAAKG